MMRIWGLRVADCRAVRIASSTFIAVSHIHNFMTRRDARSADVPGTTASGRKGQRSTGTVARRTFQEPRPRVARADETCCTPRVCSRTVGPLFLFANGREGTEHDGSLGLRAVQGPPG